MDVKKKIRDELDGFVLTVAGAYNDLIPDDVSETKFTKVVDKVSDARDHAEKNLVTLANDIVVETTVAFEEAAQKRSERLTKIIPGDIAFKAEVEAPGTAPILEASVRTPPKLEGPATPLPRDVRGSVEGALPDMDALVEAAENSLSQGGLGSSAGLVDIDNNVRVNHDLGLTVAEENRIKQGLPPKINRPTIHITGEKAVKKEQAPPAASAAPKAASYENEMKQIGKIAVKYTNSENEGVAMLASSILTIVENALNENFTVPPKEE
jgi:hypothetical protein